MTERVIVGNVETKYHVGDILKPVIDDTTLIRFHVVEIRTITCIVGTQVIYVCRIHTVRYKGETPMLTLHLTEFNEVEVELWENIGEGRK